MRRRLASVLGALALGWMGGSAMADDLMLVQGKEAPRTAGSAPVVSGAPTAAVSGAPVILNGNGSCGANGCCDNGCEGGGGSFVGGVGLYYVQPYWDSNPALTVFVPNVAGGGGVLRTTDFRYDDDFAYEGWIGYITEDGLGIRLRTWQYDDGAGPVAATVIPGVGGFVATPFTSGGAGLFTGVAGNTIVARNELDFDVWDLEVTQNVELGSCWEVTFGGGIRYAHIVQNYSATLIPAAAGVAPTFFNASNTFDGFGPSFVLEGRRKMGESMALYASTRAAILFGDNSRSAFVGPVAPFADVTDRDDVLPYGEIEIGVETGRDLGNARLVVQTGITGMIWYGLGSAVDTAPQNGNLGFFGLVARAGITF